MYPFLDMPIIDCHTHISGADDGFAPFLELMKKSGTAAFNVLSLASAREQSFTGRNLSQNLLCLLMKASCPDVKIYTFGSLYYPLPCDPVKEYDFLNHAKRLVAMGFDGFKMIEGKPDQRKLSGLPLDSEHYDDFYSYLESEGIPLLYHVADPDSFWDMPPTNAGWLSIC